MEAIARQFATGKKCLVIRNGWFSYRWTQIFECGNIPSSSVIIKARRTYDSIDAPFAPPPIDEVVSTILSERPDMVFAPHVETSSGIILPPEYIEAVTQAVHSVGGLFVLDCVASGCVWVDMKISGVDILLSAPQKGWSASPCCGIVMLSELAHRRIETTTSSSFACDLKKWLQIMKTYENGAFAYHTTMPTDALVSFWTAISETRDRGFSRVSEEQWELGNRVRLLLESRGYKSVAAEGFRAPGVVVSYCSDPDIKSGKKFVQAGIQIAAGVPLQCDEGSDFSTFRIGLFGLSKLKNIDQTLAELEDVVGKL